MTNDETLGLRITETGADPAAAKLNKLDAAALRVLKTTERQTMINKVEQKSLLDLERGYESARKRIDDYTAAKTRANKVSGDTGKSSGGDKLNTIERALNSTASLPLNNEVSQGIRLVSDFAGAIGDFNPIALAASAAAAAVAFGLKLLTESADRAAAAQQYAIDEANKNFDINFNAREQAQQKTREQLAADYDNIQAELTNTQLKLDAAKNRKAAIDEEFAGLGSSLNPQRRADLGGSGAKEAEEITRLEAAARDLQTQLTTTTFAMQGTTLATKELAAQQTAAAQDHLAAMTRNEQLSQRLADLTATGTSKQIESRIEGITREIGVLSQYQAAATEYAQSLEQGSEANRIASAQAEAYGTQIASLQLEQERLTSSTLALVKAREAEASAIAYTQQQATETAAAVKKYNDELAALNEKDADSREKLRDALIGIIEEAEKAAQDALNTLLEARASIATDFARDEDKAARDAATERINIQINSYRQELDVYKNYKRQLRDIERKAQDDSFDLILNRDFSGLFNLNRGTEIAKRDAGQAERDAIEDTREARQQQNEDLIRSLETERQGRLIALDQRLADATTAYQTEQLQIAAQRKEAETKAQAARVKEKALIDQQSAYLVQSRQNELLFISKTEQERVAILASAQNALIEQARRLLSVVTGGGSSSGGGSSANAGVQFNLSQSFAGGGMNEQRVAELSANEARKMLQRFFT